MIENQVNDLMSYFTKESSVPTETLRQVLHKLFAGEEIPKAVEFTLTKQSLISTYNSAIQEASAEERLFHLFFHLDEGKKGHLNAQDIQRLFHILNKEISINDILSSFRYSKLAHNRLSFQDFKEHFYKF